MPTTLRIQGDELRLKLGGLSSEEFTDALMKARAIPGKDYDSEAKEWVYPLSAENAQRLVQTIRVVADDAVLELVREAAEEVAAELAGRAPEDTELSLPWQDDLYPYQRAGIGWMADNKTVLNADDMGLGKTVESIGTVYEAEGLPEISNPRVLVISPNNMKRPWARTVEDGPRVKGVPIFHNWTPSEVTVLDTRTKPARQKQLSNAAPWIVMNWEKLRSDDVLSYLQQQEFDAIIADEAHRAKNYKAKQTKALHTLDAPIKLALTGTPILNSPDELFAPLCWLDPLTWGTPKTHRCTSGAYFEFYHQYVHYYEGYYGRVITGVNNPAELRFALRNTLIRRTKAQVLPDLPEKLPADEREVELTPYQRRLYKEAEEALWLEIEQAVEERPELADRVERAIEENNLQTLELMIPNAGARIVRLRQIISTPALLGGKDDSAKLNAAQEIIEDHPEAQTVVFVWFKGTAEILAERLRKTAKDENAAVAFTGDTPERERERIADEFQAGKIQTLVATIRAGGVGLDLYAASTAIFVERDWTPAYNTQAEDRLHRQGQKNPVTIIRLDAADTIDVGRIRPTNRLKELIVMAMVGAD